jgi:hypothetical protein
VKAAAIHKIGLSVPLVQSNLGKFKDYCPVSFIEQNELRKGENTLEFMAEYDVSSFFKK